ncbi:hypothetical protein M514_23446 [Trichuris suis]|uniref:Uncharacterized protein n=1 Tax=Trichuris suis TaxID=68888 RepID=A0A085N4M6_9BILA|nr:hypothetical protein M514_23446 [Trichuris suis]
MLDDRGGFDRLGHDLLWLLPLWASSSFGARPRRCLWLLESANGLFVSSDVGHVSFISIKCSRKVSSFPTVVMAKMSFTYRLKKMGASEVLMLGEGRKLSLQTRGCGPGLPFGQKNAHKESYDASARQTILQVRRCSYRFTPDAIVKASIEQHTCRHFGERMILSLSHAVLLWRVWHGGFVLYAFTVEEVAQFAAEIFSAIVCTKSNRTSTESILHSGDVFFYDAGYCSVRLLNTMRSRGMNLYSALSAVLGARLFT